MSPLPAPNPKCVPAEGRLHGPRQRIPDKRHELRDGALETTPAFDLDDQDKESRTQVAFLFFLYGTFCGFFWSAIFYFLFLVDWL